jgi:uncharacterized RDD family membrane protein YckC
MSLVQQQIGFYSVNDNNPTPDFDVPPPVPSPHIDNTASLGKRFAATCIDIAIMMFCLMPMVQSMGLVELVEKQQAIPPEAALKLVAFQLMMFFILHGFLLQQYGQTIGKRIIGIAIVTLDNRKPAFLPLILQRYVSQWLMGMVPVLGVLLRLADVLFIFRDDRRCIHDLLAGTKVIDLKITVTQNKPSSIIV